MKEKVFKFLPFLAAIFAWSIFYFIGKGVKVPCRVFFSYGTSFLLWAILLINLIFSLKQDYTNVKIKTQRAILGKQKEKAEKDIKAVVKRLRKVLLVHWLVFFTVITLFCLLIFLLAAYGMYFAPVYILIVVFLWGLIDMLFIVENNPLPDIEIYERDYPELFKVIYEAASIVGAGKHIRVFLQGNNISVLKHKKYDCILIGDLDMNILTKDEMKQILLHEFAHIYNKNTILSEKLMTASARWQTSTGNYVAMLGKMTMKIPEFYLQREIFFFRICASRVVEFEADRIVKRLGDRQAYVNSLAKSYAFLLFTDMPCPERDIYIYESEEPTYKYGEIMLSLYYKYLDKNESLWRRILDNELTPFLDSHPTFRMRKEDMSICNYTFNTKETDKKYIEEQKSILALGDASRKKNIEESYAEIRDYRYVKRFAAIEEYEKNKNQSIQKLIDTALYYESVNNGKAKEIFNLILQKDENNAYAYFHLGRMLLYEFDEKGIKYIYKAIDCNDSFTNDGLELIGNFCIKAGLEEELLKYRENIESIGQAALDKTRIITEVNSLDKLLPHDLSESVFDEILDYMLKTAAGKLEKIYLVKKVKGDIYSYVFLVKRSPEVTDNDFNDLYYDIFRYLDFRKEQFTLLEIYDKKKIKWLTRKVKGCIVWSKC